MLDFGHIVEGLTGRKTAVTAEITQVVVDSRAASQGCLFVALPGECVDGHDFVQDAFDRGAVAAVVKRPIGATSVIDTRRLVSEQTIDLELPVCVVVENTLAALQKLATYWRARHSVRVIGITGSVGKTTTKELAHAVLSEHFRTLKSEGNLNNEIGLPLTLMHLTDAHERAVLEMGMYVGGEISTLTDIARPQVGVVTNIGPVHLERAGSLRAIADAKAELVEALPAAPDGVAILNQDEPLVREMAGRTQARVFTYGLGQGADLWADRIEGVGLDGIRFSLHYQGEAVHIRAPLLGRHSVHTALRAAAVGLVEGLGWSEIVGGLQSDTPQLRLVAVYGPGDSLLLDDTYNASPASTIAALNLLDDLPKASPTPVARARRVAVLGDMLELGSYEELGHRLVGRRVIDAADFLVTVGDLGRIIAEEALAGGMPPESVLILPDVEAATSVLPEIIGTGDVVLVKGSRGVRLDRLVDSLAREGSGTEALPEGCS